MIGHNDKGMFKFPDGSWLGLADMAETCATHGKRCVFLSCEAQQHVSGAAAVGSARRLTHDEASTVANDIRGLSDVGPVSLADVADVLVRAQRKYQTNRLIVRAVGGGAVAILVAHELLDDEEKK